MMDAANSWSRFSRGLFQMLREIPISPQSSAPSFDIAALDTEDLIASLRDAEYPLRPSIEAALQAWPQSPDPWANLAPDALFFLQLRVKTSWHFSLLFCLAGDHPESSFLDFPSTTAPDDLARFLLTTWWQAHGFRLAANEMLSDWHDARFDVD